MNELPTNMDELLAFAETLTVTEYVARREQLLLAFEAKHGLYTVRDIEKAIRTHAIPESLLVEDWMELRAFEPAMSKLLGKRSRKRREETHEHQGRESGPFSFRTVKHWITRRLYCARDASGGREDSTRQAGRQSHPARARKT